MPRTIRLLTGAILGAFALSACSSPEPTAPTTASPVTESAPAQEPASGWPRTITVAGEDVTIGEQPARIVAITSETADLALLLAGPDRIRAVAASSQSPHSGTAVELAAQVETTLPPGTDPEPEYLLSLNPDLVVSTSRHGGERIAAEQLQTTGIPVLNFDADSFGSPDGLAEVIEQLGAALGEEDTAEQLSSDLIDHITQIDGDRSGNTPAALALMARGNQVMAMDSTSMLPHLIERAGGTNSATGVGITQTRPVDAELVAKANPEIIFLEGFQGQGSDPFEALLSNPALADVPAIANDQVHVIPMNQASALSGINTPHGYRAIVEIVNEL